MKKKYLVTKDICVMLGYLSFYLSEGHVIKDGQYDLTRNHSCIKLVFFVVFHKMYFGRSYLGFA